MQNSPSQRRGCGWMVLLGILFAGLLLMNSMLAFGGCLWLRDTMPFLNNGRVFQTIVCATTIFLLTIEIIAWDRLLTRSRLR